MKQSIRQLCTHKEQNRIDDQSVYRSIIDHTALHHDLKSVTNHRRWFDQLWRTSKKADRLINTPYNCHLNLKQASEYYDEKCDDINDEEEEIPMDNTISNTKNSLLKKLQNNVIDYSINKIKTTIGVNLRLNFQPENYRKFLCWLKKYDKSFYHHIVKIPYKPYYVLKDCDFFIKVSDCTFARVLSGESILKNCFDGQRRHLGSYAIDMYIFGKNATEVAATVEKLQTINNLSTYTITVSNRKSYKGNSDEYAVDIYRDPSSGRNKDSIFLNDNIKDNILSHIHKFFSNKPIYDKRNLTYKTGILLYGEPGTGKTSIANMLSTECNCDLVVIGMNNFTKLDTDYITSVLNADDETYIVLLEDIDCVIGNRESDDDVENKKNVNKLLQFLDSTSSPSNVIFIATTNHIEKLDDAILRDGRFDLKVNISNINESTAAQMCKSFGITDSKKIKRLFKDNNENGKVNPAKLQNAIIKEIG